MPLQLQLVRQKFAHPNSFINGTNQGDQGKIGPGNTHAASKNSKLPMNFS
jgi:hypothetical protein